MSADDQLFNEEALRNFREYLQIPTVQPDVDYEGCVKFFQRQAQELGLPCKIIGGSPKKPILVITWTGTQPDLPSIVLSSHMDVVPAYEENWKHKPFGAEIEDGKVYARGSQDMKSAAIQYVEAVRLFMKKCVTLRRTIHIVFVPDEEIGGIEGMKHFIGTKEFEEMNVGFAMDEGVAGRDDKYVVFYAERSLWEMNVHCPTDMEKTAAEKLAHILNKFLEFRQQQLKKIEADPSLTPFDVIGIEINEVKGGVYLNVMPPEFNLRVDCRFPLGTDVIEFENMANQWCKEAGADVWIEYFRKEPLIEPTKVDNSNPFWKAFKNATDELKLHLHLMVCPGTTDMRYLRGLGIPAIGFQPINHHNILLHSNDEYLEVDTFLKGIQIYYKLLSKIGNI